MDASEEDVVCPAEEAIGAFLDYLVDPILPPKSSARDAPSLSQQEEVAKQVHAVVLLYNYYHRKQCLKLDFVNFHHFCKFLLVLRPAILAHMKFKQVSSDTELEDPDKQLSLTEKSIMDACNISRSLDASKDVPKTEGWPISKVTVLVVDSTKENCLLLFSSTTQGVWSVIEKHLDATNTTVAKQGHKTTRVIGKPPRGESSVDEASFEKLAYSAVSEAKGINQADLVVLESHVVFSVSEEKAAACFFIIGCTQEGSQDIISVPIKDVIDSLEGPLIQKSSSSWTVTPVVEYFHVLPYAAILLDWFSRRELSNGLQVPRKEEVNITVNSSEKIERLWEFDLHDKDVNKNRSRSKPQSRKKKDPTGCSTTSLAHASNGPQINQVDDSSMVPSQNGECCKNISSPTLVVNHDEKMISCNRSEANGSESAFLPSRREFPNGSQGSREEEGNINVNSPEKIERLWELDVEKNRTRSKPQSRRKKDTTRCSKTGLADAFSGPEKIQVDGSSMFHLQNGESCKNISSTTQVVNHEKNRTSCIRSESNGPQSNLKAKVVNSRTRPFHTDCGVENVLSGKKICNIDSSDQDCRGDHASGTDQSSSLGLRKLQSTLASKENVLSQTALNVLMKRRDGLALQQRSIEDEIALCDKKIQTILNVLMTTIGGEDDLALQVESIIEGCNDAYVRSMRTLSPLEDQCRPQNIKRKRLSEAILTVQNPCQELDGVCYGNNWILPTYHVSPAAGGFQAVVTVKGMDFECSSAGDLHFDPREARESAATKALAKLRSMASQSQKF